MNIEEFREYCLSFKGVHEKMPFPNVPDQYSRDVLCFYVADKWFCFVNIEIFDFCCIKCNPDESGELQTEYAGIFSLQFSGFVRVAFDTTKIGNLNVNETEPFVRCIKA